MQSSDPRVLIWRALLLDWLGQALVIGLLLVEREGGSFMQNVGQIENFWPWMFFCFLLYPLLGWLFGSYTVLRWRHLPVQVLLQRLALASLASLLLVAVVRWFLNPAPEVWLVHRSVQVIWLPALFGWSLMVRLCLRRGFLSPERPRIVMLAEGEEWGRLLEAWKRVPQRDQLHRVSLGQLSTALAASQRSCLVVVSPGMREKADLLPLLESLEAQDPRQVRVLSSLRLFSQQQERLPPFLMPESRLDYDEIPWNRSFSLQTQLKRVADVVVAGSLLAASAPFIFLAALLIWLEDQGPVWYVQERSGLLGQPFRLMKLRTMTVQPQDAPAVWTSLGDQRITSVGLWLRRLRLDELPQLLNVIRGEMSLIGPRPERPELEHQLEQAIPHYRKRHWMRPGLSGWAQVCAPYASSIEDSDLKLSYDLYYLVNFNTWLDIIILFRTIKTVLKAEGR